MKYLAAFAFAAIPFFAFAAGDYILELDGKPFEMSLNTRTNVVLQNGQSVSATLKMKEVLTFEGDLFSFEHKNTITPQRVELEKGVFQTSFMISPNGSIVIIQEYTRGEPLSVIDAMVRVLTKKEVAAGYQLTEEKAERRLADGTVFIGKKVTTTLGDNEWIRYVLASGQKGEGLLVTTHVAAKHATEDGAVVEAFWKSLRVKKPKAG